MSTKRNDAVQRSASARWALWGGGLVAALGVLAVLVTQQSIAADVVVYESPTCGCCGKWVKHLEDAGVILPIGGFHRGRAY